MAKEIHSLLCGFCSVRFYYNIEDTKLHCPVCGQTYYYKDGEWTHE